MVCLWHDIETALSLGLRAAAPDGGARERGGGRLGRFRAPLRQRARGSARDVRHAHPFTRARSAASGRLPVLPARIAARHPRLRAVRAGHAARRRPAREDCHLQHRVGRRGGRRPSPSCSRATAWMRSTSRPASTFPIPRAATTAGHPPRAAVVGGARHRDHRHAGAALRHDGTEPLRRPRIARGHAATACAPSAGSPSTWAPRGWCSVRRRTATGPGCPTRTPNGWPSTFFRELGEIAGEPRRLHLPGAQSRAVRMQLHDHAPRKPPAIVRAGATPPSACISTPAPSRSTGRMPPPSSRATADIIAHVHASEPDLVPLGDGGTDHVERGRCPAPSRAGPHREHRDAGRRRREPHVAAIDRALAVAIRAYRDDGADGRQSHEVADPDPRHRGERVGERAGEDRGHAATLVSLAARSLERVSQRARLGWGSLLYGAAVRPLRGRPHAAAAERGASHPHLRRHRDRRPAVGRPLPRTVLLDDGSGNRARDRWASCSSPRGCRDAEEHRRPQRHRPGAAPRLGSPRVPQRPSGSGGASVIAWSSP